MEETGRPKNSKYLLLNNFFFDPKNSQDINIDCQETNKKEIDIWDEFFLKKEKKHMNEKECLQQLIEIPRFLWDDSKNFNYQSRYPNEDVNSPEFDPDCLKRPKQEICRRNNSPSKRKFEQEEFVQKIIDNKNIEKDIFIENFLQKDFEKQIKNISNADELQPQIIKKKIFTENNTQGDQLVLMKSKYSKQIENMLKKNSVNFWELKKPQTTHIDPKRRLNILEKNNLKIKFDQFLQPDPHDKTLKKVLTPKQILFPTDEFRSNCTKIRDLSVKSNNVSVEGQIIFMWDKIVVNQKWATNTIMQSVQIRDETGSIMVFIPNDTSQNIKFEFRFGQFVIFSQFEVFEKFTNQKCLFAKDNSKFKTIERHQLQNLQKTQPEKIGISLKELIKAPITSICNIVCLVVKQSQIERINTMKKKDFKLGKITAFDPIDNIQVVIKLWNEKTKINFYTSGTVYLLRGIEVKQYKGIREYNATPYFNFRELKKSSIDEYLARYMQERNLQLKTPPFLRQNYLQKINHSNFFLNEQQTTEQQIENSIINKKILQKCQTRQDDQKFECRVLISWAECIVKIKSIVVSPNYINRKYYCPKCDTKILIDCRNQGNCPCCGGEEKQSVFWIKCEIQDSQNTYLAEMHELVAEKIIGGNEMQMFDLHFFENAPYHFKQSVAGSLIGREIKVIVASMRQRLSNNIWMDGNYITKIQPFNESSKKIENSLKSNNIYLR